MVVKIGKCKTCEGPTFDGRDTHANGGMTCPQVKGWLADGLRLSVLFSQGELDDDAVGQDTAQALLALAALDRPELFDDKHWAHWARGVLEGVASSAMSDHLELFAAERIRDTLLALQVNKVDQGDNQVREGIVRARVGARNRSWAYCADGAMLVFMGLNEREEQAT